MHLLRQSPIRMAPRTLATLSSLVAAASLVYAGWEPSLLLYVVGLVALGVGFLAFTVVAVRDLTEAFADLTGTVPAEHSRG